MTFQLMDLPYPYEALQPHMSADTLRFHHDKHHRTYVETLNKLLEDSPLAERSLEEIVRESARDEARTKIFNNAGQVWNHNFFWNSMKPEGGGRPRGELGRRIEESFGGFEDFKRQFVESAAEQFGSGWTWLVLEGDALAIMSTPNAVMPLVEGRKALLTCDVWEHAYYLDYQNRRADFVETFLDGLANWEFAERQLAEGGRGSRAAEQEPQRRRA